MRLALFGRTGQVATEVRRRAPEDVDLVVLDRTKADFRDPEAVEKAVNSIDADVILNAAAYTAVDEAEVDEATAMRVNGTSVAALARAAARRDIPLIHMSTDYVFDGSGTEPWRPDDPTHPLSVYGKSKLCGEEAIRASGVRHVILRTSWVFSAHGANFVKTMLRLGQERDRLTIVSDQVGGPTPAAAIADAALTIAVRLSNEAISGTYHLSGTPDATWAGLAREVFRRTGMEAEVADTATVDYPTPAPRPLNSRLDCESLEADFGIRRPDWREGLADVLKELS